MSEPRAGLVALDGAGREGAVFELVRARTTLGRDPGSGITVLDAGASRRHCELERDGARYFVRDLGSRNGTLVNDAPCERRRALGAGDVLQIGEARFRFVPDVSDRLGQTTARPGAASGRARRGVARLVGPSRAMHAVRELARRFAQTPGTVLVTGETGTGKEVLARAVHEESPRAKAPFVAVNAGAIADALLLSELFGHERGAFTGAAERRRGRFEEAGDGTLFLDEVGELSPAAQVALLRVLDRGEMTRVGGSEVLVSRARLVCATNRLLARMVEEGAFREDLWHRIRGLEVRLPPLRERAGDVAILADHLLGEIAGAWGVPRRTLTDRALARLAAHRWPGNVRELRNALERAMALTAAQAIDAADLAFLDAPPASADPSDPRTLAAREREHIARVLEETGWNVKRSAEVLGIQRRTLYGKLKRFGLERPG